MEYLLVIFIFIFLYLLLTLLQKSKSTQKPSEPEVPDEYEIAKAIIIRVIMRAEKTGKENITVITM